METASGDAASRVSAPRVSSASVGITEQTGKDSSEGKSERGRKTARKDGGQEKTTGCAFERQPREGTEQRTKTALAKTADPGGKDMPGRDLSRHGGWRVRNGH